MNSKAKKIMIVFDDEDRWSAACESGISFDEAMRMIPRAWKEHDKPKEPLIKDEKVRKAVRAWAEVNELEPDYEVKYDADTYGLNSWQADINFNYRIEGLEHNKKYTITELCGEEMK